MPKPATYSGGALKPSASRSDSGDESTPRILAVAAAFGFDVAPELLAPQSADADEATADGTGADDASVAVLMAAKALGIGPTKPEKVAVAAPTQPVTVVAATPETAPTPAPTAKPIEIASRADAAKPVAALATDVSAAAEAVPVDDDVAGPPLAAEEDAVPVVAEVGDEVALSADGSVEPVADDAGITADKLEAALLGQLRVLEETLQQPPPRHLPPATPLRRASGAERRPSVQLADPAGAPGRSPFAPDPVRQRTYVDLREPAPAPDSGDDAPWRKYLDESRPVPARPTPVRRPSSRPRVSRPPPASVLEAGETAAERRRGIRAMSAAAVLGLGVGLGLLVLARPFAETTPPSEVTAVVEPAAPVAVASADDAASPASAHPVDEALATLLADPSDAAPSSGPAVIAEAGTPPEELVADATPVPPPVAAPPLIRPPPGQPLQVARAAPLYGPDAPSTSLAYGPTTPSYDPVRQSLLNDDAEAAATDEAEATPTADRAASAPRGDRATVRSFVNMRAKPDNGAPVVAVLAQGLSVKVLGCDYWCEIEAGGKRGYVYKKFVGR